MPWTQEQFRQLSLVNLTEDQLIKEVLKLKENFTVARDKKLQDYLARPEAVSAYFQYYLPTNFPKLPFLFDQLPKAYLQTLKNRRWVDYGCGPGTYTAALLSLSADLAPSEVVLVDSSELMLKQAQKFLTQVFPEQKFSFLNSLPESVLKDERSVMIFGNSLNEMSPSFAKTLLIKFRGLDLFWIEPGTIESFRSLSEYRSFLLSDGYKVLYPCPSSHTQCPALLKDKTEWCHQVLRMTHPDWVERLSQKMQIDRKEMPLIAHAYSRSYQQQDARDTMVRIRPETKHSLEWDLCRLDEDQKVLEWRRASVAKKSLERAQLKAMGKMSTGLKVDLEVVKELADGCLKVELKK